MADSGGNVSLSISSLLLLDSAARGPGFKGHYEAGAYVRGGEGGSPPHSNPMFSLDSGLNLLLNIRKKKSSMEFF